MNKGKFRDYAQRASKAAAKHWAWSSVCTLLILASLIWSVGWLAAGVLAQFLVALIALGGYRFSYKLYHEQEEHKYKVAVVAAFPVPLVANVSAPRPENHEKRRRMLAWSPGFVLRMEEAGQVLDAEFHLENISESPAIDVRMDVYMHDYEELDTRPGKPTGVFRESIPLVDGIAKSAEVPFKRTLRALDFSWLLSLPIPSEVRGEPARWSRWTLVLKYRNLQGEPFFSAYKLEGAVETLSSLQMSEYFRMVFWGSFPGDYLKDDEYHQFIANRGFPSAGTAPDWEGIKALSQERAAVASAPSNPPSPF